MPYYAVAKGRSAGVYNSWDDCSKNVNGYSGATYKKFATRSEADNFVNEQSGGGYGNSTYGSSSTSRGGNARDYSSRDYYSSNSSGTGSYSRDDYSRRDRSPARLSHSALESLVPYSGYDGGSYCGENKAISTRCSATKEKIYVDGAARGNGKFSCPKSGYGVYYGPGDSRNSSVPLSDVDDISKIRPTNQRAELHAMHHALKNIHEEYNSNPGMSKSYEIHTDSTYTKKSIDTWADGWKKNNWKTSSGSKVANQDIIERTHDLYSTLTKKGVSVDLIHVKGHLGVEGNEQADRLANEGADRM